MSLSPVPIRVLISGAGIAGPCLAYWLSRARLNASITIVERSPVPRTTGQSIDIRGSAISIIKKMKLEEKVRARDTTEEGTRVLGQSGKVLAEFGKGDTFTAEYEILRADLCGLFLSSTENLPNVNYVYGDRVTSLTQSRNDATVTFASGNMSTYDLVVGADGSTSKIRSMVLDKESLEDSYKFIGQYIAFFSIERSPTDTPHWYWYTTPKGLGLMTRPHRNPSTIGVYMCITTPARGHRYNDVEAALEEGPEAQKHVLAKYFKNTGWQAERLISGMQTSPDFYMSRAALVKLPVWHSNRAVLLGDAAFATFGIGTSLAIQSAYYLAGEVSKIKTADDIPKALENYEKTFRPVYGQHGDLPKAFPQMAFPQTKSGLSLRNLGLWLASKTKIYKLFPEDRSKEIDLEEYDWQDI